MTSLTPEQIDAFINYQVASAHVEYLAARIAEKRSTLTMAMLLWLRGGDHPYRADRHAAEIEALQFDKTKAAAKAEDAQAAIQACCDNKLARQLIRESPANVLNVEHKTVVDRLAKQMRDGSTLSPSEIAEAFGLPIA